MRRWWTGVCAIALIAGCDSEDHPAYEAGEVARAVSEQWSTADIFVPDDAFSEPELRCIDRVGADVTAEEIETAAAGTFAESPERLQRFMQEYFDQCLTDDHLQRWFFTDMDGRSDLRFSAEKADCLSHHLVGLMRDVGFGDLFRDRTAAAAAELERLRQSCGIRGPETTSTAP